MRHPCTAGALFMEQMIMKVSVETRAMREITVAKAILKTLKLKSGECIELKACDMRVTQAIRMRLSRIKSKDNVCFSTELNEDILKVKRL
jgi:hypothetical protein